MEAGIKCIKYLLFGFNLIFFIIGLILIIAGSVVEVKFEAYFAIIGQDFNHVAVFLIVLGLIIFVIGFFGCCGAWKENRCMVLTFAVMLVIIFVLEFSAGIAGFALRNQVENVTKHGLEKSLNKYNATGFRKMWASMQENLHCCGVSSYADWEGKVSSTECYPKSCCMPAEKTKPGCGTSSTLAYKRGCLPVLKEFINNNLVAIGGIGMFVALVEILGAALACLLGRAIGKSYQTV